MVIVAELFKPIYEQICDNFYPLKSHSDVLPPKNMLDLTKDFITYAIESGYLLRNYTLYGHRQIRPTTCPGDALYGEIKTWPHFGKDT